MSRRSPRRLCAAGGGLAVALVALAPRVAMSQCDASVKPAPGEVGYKKRPYACEGMYIGLQSAPVGVQVVSLVRGSLRYSKEAPSDSVLYVKARPSASRLEPEVRVIGRARQANLHWALDGSVRVDRPMRWNLETVVKPMELDSAKIGVYGVARRRGPDGSLGGPIFVPLEITRARAASASEPVELIVRVPMAAELCWLVQKPGAVQPVANTSCERRVSPVDGNPDGYFRIVIPPLPEGEHQLAIRWRPRGTQAFGNPVHFNVYFW
ncbi:MAG TPA: hypothetical protein VJ802_15155 [Gemmatimonadaceae bacterium]|nr:hypothetical protein [Gemmatimonadaceae bacterium]